MFKKCLTGVLAVLLLINGGEASRLGRASLSRGPSTHYARHVPAPEHLNTSDYRFLTNKTKRIQYILSFY